MLPRPRVWAIVLFVALGGCDDGDPPPTDAGSPPPTTCEELPDELVDGDPDGNAAPLEVPDGQVRAGRLTEAQLPPDPTALALYRAGDVVLTNGRFALIIEGADPSDGYDPFGGRPIGIASVGDGALVDAGDFNELLFGLGKNLVETESVSVLADGSDGGPAIVRARGPLGPLEFIGRLGDVVPRTDVGGLPAAVDYTMQPGEDVVDVSIVVQSREPRGYRIPILLAASFQASRMPLWINGEGFGELRMTALEDVLYVDDGRTSYALLGPDRGSLTPILEESGTLIYNLGSSAAQPCAETRISIGSVVLGGPGLSGLQRSLAGVRGESLRTITGTLRHANGDPAPDARLHVRRADGRHFARRLPASDGTFSVAAPPEDVELFAVLPGTPLVGPVAVPAGTDAATITLPDTGTVAVTITAEDGTTPIPARVQLLPVAGFEAYPRDLGERRLRSGRSHIEFAVTGATEIAAAPGDYDVIVSRGFEHELHTERVTIAAGATVDVVAALAHSVDSAGVMCADYHIHTHRSPDSPDSPQRKLLSLVADGLEIAVRSDHEWVNDFAPVIADLGIGQYVLGISGEELTTFAYGHFGVFPLDADPSVRSGGAIQWVNRRPPETFDAARARPEAPDLIINHPRSSGSLGGYFNAAGFDRTTGMVANPDQWDEEFALVEVFNDDSFEEQRDSVVADWFALLETGRRVFAVGSSDSHDIDGSPVGYPRTCLRLGTDDPRAITPNDVRDVTAAGASVISGGVLIDVTGPGGEGPGETIAGAGTSVDLDLRVQAPSWIDGDLTLEVVVDGQTTETIELLESDRDPLNPAIRLQSAVSVPAAPAGSWVVLHVSSTADLAPVHPGRDAFGVTNPIFLAP